MTNTLEGQKTTNNHNPALPLLSIKRQKQGSNNKREVVPTDSGGGGYYDDENEKSAFVVVEEHANNYYSTTTPFNCNNPEAAKVTYNRPHNIGYQQTIERWYEENSWMIENSGERDSKVFQVLLLIVLVAIIGVGFLSILFGILSVSYRDDETFYLPTSCSVLEKYGCSCENDDADRFLSDITSQLTIFESPRALQSNHIVHYSTNVEPVLHPCPTQRKCVFKTLIHHDNSTRTTCVLFPELNYPIGLNTTCYLSKNHSGLVSFTVYSSVNESMKMIAILFGIIGSALLVVTIFFSIIVACFKQCQRRKFDKIRRKLNFYSTTNNPINSFY